MSQAAYLVQDPRTLNYYRWNENASDVIADVPEDKWMNKASLFLEEHLVHVPSDAIRTEVDKATRIHFARKKGWENAQGLVMASKQRKGRARARKNKQKQTH